MKTKFTACFHLFNLLLIAQCIFAGKASLAAAGPSEHDPFIYTDYRRAFNQQDVLDKFADVVNAEGLGHLLSKSGAMPAHLEMDIESQQPLASDPGVRERLSHWLKGQAAYAPITTRQTTVRNSKTLDEALKEDFLKKKRADAYLPIKNEIRGTLIYSTAMAIILSTSSQILPKEWMSTGTGFGGFVIASDVASTVNNACKHYFRMKHFTGDPLVDYELKYATQKRSIKPELWEGIEARFLAARTNAYGRQAHTEFFDRLFTLPRQFKIPSPPQSQEERSASFSSLRAKRTAMTEHFKNTFDSFFATAYDDTNEELTKIASAFWEHLNANLELDKPASHQSKNSTHPKAPTSRRPLFLHGEAGLGKTTMVEHLAKAFAFPLIIVNLSEAASPEALFGSKEKAGLLLTKLTSSPYKNAILFFDEASEALNNNTMTALFKGLFEPDRGRFESSYLDLELDLSHYMIIAAGNNPLEDKALKSRFITLDYPKFKPAYLKTFAYKEMIPMLLDKATYLTKIEDLSVEEKEELDKIINECRTPRELGHRLPLFFNNIDLQRIRLP